MRLWRAWIAALAAVGIVSLASMVLPVRGASDALVAPGLVEGAGPTMAIGAGISGIVTDIPVHEGSSVRAGDVLIKLDCGIVQADLRNRQARLAEAQAVLDRTHNGPRADEIAVGEAVVGYSKARADEAKKTLDRTDALQEGVTVSTARVLEVERDASIAAAQLEEARARLSLLRAGAREEDVRQAQAARDAAAADLDSVRAQLDQCTIRAPSAGVVLDVPATRGELFSVAAPQPLLHLTPDGPPRIRAEIEGRDAAHVCVGQATTVTSDVDPGAPLHAQVVSIAPQVAVRTLPAAAGQSGNIVPVTLAFAQDTPTLPLGMTVTVHFAACPPKT